MGNSLLLVLLLFFMFHFNSLLTCSSSSSPSSADPNSPFLCHPLQSHALLQFKSTFTIDDYHWCGDLSSPKTESWKEGTDCCSSWDGVTCNEKTGHVIELDLSCSQLVGKIHSNNSLFSPHFPPYLQRLNLAANEFLGSNILSQFGAKFGSSLTHLNLSVSYISGDIPSEISHLSNLVSLDLSFNNFFEIGLKVESDRVLERIVQNLTQLRVLHLDMIDMSSVVHASSILMNLSSSLTSLRLYDCQLQGQFPVSFFLHPNLQVLILSGNYFDRVTSPPVFNSNNLTDLVLSNTDLSSVSIGFLDFVANLKSLRTLDMSNCSLRGSFSPSFGNLTKLTTLFMQANNFSGPIPASFCNMTQLLDLNLGDNQLDGMLPSCLFAMPSLNTLSLNDNNLHGQVPIPPFKSVTLTLLNLTSNSGSFDLNMLLYLKKLKYLYLSHNNLSSSTATGYNLRYSLPSLLDLDLSSSNLAWFPSFLKTIPNLASLDISNNKIQGSIPEWMFGVGNTGMLHWKNIRFLDFHSNLLQGYLPIPPLTIEFFSVSDNNFTGEISSLICNLTSLEVFDLSHNLFVGLIPPCLGSLSSLSVLNLEKNNLHGSIPNIFTKGNSLNYLVLNENQLRGRLPHSLSYCHNLQVLDVGNNKIEDVFPHWLEILSTLQVLVLRSNKFFGSINGFNSHVSFPNLRILDVSNNNFIGLLPTRLINNLEAMKNGKEGLGYMKTFNATNSLDSYKFSMIITTKGSEMEYEKILNALTIIDFSQNRFEGDIPEVMGKLGALIGLNLSHNLLTGHIPSSTRDLVNLEWLDLSSNKLVGQIPRVLADLTFLAVLNLSHNQLDGPIPRGNQFGTFGNDSYKENPGLCGFPLSKTCSTNDETSSHKNIDSADSASGFSWEGTFVGYGCGIVFGVLMGYLVFSSGSPQWFVRMVEGKHGHGRSKQGGHKRRHRKRRN